MRINVRFLLRLTIAAIALVSVTVFLHRIQVRRTSGGIASMARQAAADGRVDEAVDLYQRFLQLQPNDSSARAELGRLLAKRGQFEAAFFEYERALRAEPERMETRRHLVDVAFQLRRFDDARTHLTEHLLVSEPNSAEYCWQLGGLPNGAGAIRQRSPTAHESGQPRHGSASLRRKLSRLAYREPCRSHGSTRDVGPARAGSAAKSRGLRGPRSLVASTKSTTPGRGRDAAANARSGVEGCTPSLGARC